MSYNMNYNEESNVAYFGTSDDLQFGDFGFMKEGADMQLFGGFEETSDPADNALMLSLTEFTKSTANPATVSPQELSMAPPQSEYIPSSASIPELTPAESLVYDYSGSGSPLFSNPNSADPSPVLQDDMAPSGAYQNFSLFAAEEQYVPTGADLLARHTESLPPPTPKSAVLGPASSGIRKNSRKPARPLKEINLDLITDEKERKKAKNTEAARRSRQKRADHEATLEAKIAALEQQLKAEKDKNEQLQAYINSHLGQAI